MFTVISSCISALECCLLDSSLMISQVVLHLLLDFKFIFIIIYSFASLITLDKILQYT